MRRREGPIARQRISPSELRDTGLVSTEGTTYIDPVSVARGHLDSLTR
jgi:hypothetical protein